MLMCAGMGSKSQGARYDDAANWIGNLEYPTMRQPGPCGAKPCILKDNRLLYDKTKSCSNVSGVRRNGKK